MPSRGIMRIKMLGDTSGLSKALSQSEAGLLGWAKKVTGALAGMYIFKQAADWIEGTVRAGLEEQAGMERLADALRRTTGATTAVIDANEAWITRMQDATAVADDQMRPVLMRLVSSTKDLGRAQELLSVALDISAGRGLDLQTVALAMEKAYNGQTSGLQRLGIAIHDASGETLSFEQIMQRAIQTYGGAAQAAAEDTAGKIERLKMALSDAREAIGMAFLPVVERALPLVRSFAEWVGNLAESFKQSARTQGIGAAVEQLVKRAVSDFSSWFKERGASALASGLVALVKTGLTDILPALLDLAGDLLEGITTGLWRAFWVDFADAQEMKRITERLQKQLEENTRRGITGGLERAAQDIVGEKTKTLLEYLYGGGREITYTKATQAAELLRQQNMQVWQPYLEALKEVHAQGQTTFGSLGQMLEEASEEQEALNEATEAYYKLVSDLFTSNISPARAWDEARGRLARYVRLMDEQVSAWARMQDNLKTLAARFPEFTTDVLLEAAKLGPKFIDALTGAKDPELARRALESIRMTLSENVPAMADKLRQDIESSRMSGAWQGYVEALKRIYGRQAGQSVASVLAQEYTAYSWYPVGYSVGQSVGSGTTSGIAATNIPGRLASSIESRNWADVGLGVGAELGAGIQRGLNSRKYSISITGRVHSAGYGGTYLEYDSGGYLPPGPSLVVNRSGRPEPVFTAEQWDRLLQALERAGGDGGGPVYHIGSVTVDASRMATADLEGLIASIQLAARMGRV